MTPISRLIAAVCLLLCCLSPARAGDGVTVFAAASLRDALQEVFEDRASQVTVSYGGSGLMARQVAHGAPADLVLLANSAWMDWLDQAGHLAPDTRRDLLGNALVLVAPRDAPPLGEVTPEALLARLAGGRLAVGHTQGVPAGIYARQWLENAGFWAALAPHLAETESVRAALALVSRGEAPLGIVYGSDALADTGVQVLHRIDPSLHDPIVYPLAVVRDRARPEVLTVAEHLASPAAAEIFRRHGFTVVGGDG